MCDLLKLLFIWNFHNKIVCMTQSDIFLCTAEYDCVIKTMEMFNCFL